MALFLYSVALLQRSFIHLGSNRGLPRGKLSPGSVRSVDMYQGDAGYAVVGWSSSYICGKMRWESRQLTSVDREWWCVAFELRVRSAKNVCICVSLNHILKSSTAPPPNSIGTFHHGIYAHNNNVLKTMCTRSLSDLFRFSRQKPGNIKRFPLVVLNPKYILYIAYIDSLACVCVCVFCWVQCFRGAFGAGEVEGRLEKLNGI